MASSQQADVVGLTPGTSSGGTASPGSPRRVRHFPEDPYSDGILMALFDGRTLLYRRDVYFQAKLTRAERILYERQDVYFIVFELNFMKSFSQQYRFRGADINVTVQRDFTVDPSDSEPSIRKILPTVIAADMSDREIQKSNSITAGTGGTAGPAQLNLSLEQTHQDKTNFKGIRKFHGLIKGNNTASWRLYEEKESQSGIPSIFRLAALVRCTKGEFQVKLEVSARMAKWPKIFGLHNLYFTSSFSADIFIRTIPELPIPIDWYELYKKVEQILLIEDLIKEGDSKEVDVEEGDSDVVVVIEERDSCSMDGAMSRFWNRLETGESFDKEEKEIIADFHKDFMKVQKANGEEATILKKLKEYLASHDESNKAIDRLEKFMGISIPDRQEGSSDVDAPSITAPPHSERSPAIWDSYTKNLRARSRDDRI